MVLARKRKIAICFPQVPFFHGGAELHVSSLKRELQARGYEAEIVSMPFKWYPTEQLVSSMMAWRNLDLSESNGEKIDLVIGTKFPSYGINHPNKVTWLIHQFRQVYDLFGTPYSEYSYQPEHLSIKEFIYRFDNKTLTESKRIYTNASNTMNRLKKFNSISSEVLYHPPQLVGQYYCDGFENYILSVGRLDKLKRTEKIIAAFAKLKTSEIKLVVVGRGPEKEPLERLARDLNVHDRVIFKGFVEDKELLNLYANCLAVYYAPFDEDYGYVTLEAFLSRKPVISLSDAGGVLEFLQHEKNGFVLDNDEQVAESIEILFSNKLLAKEMGMYGYNLVKDISWDYVISRLTETLD